MKIKGFEKIKSMTFLTGHTRWTIGQISRRSIMDRDWTNVKPGDAPADIYKIMCIQSEAGAAALFTIDFVDFTMSFRLCKFGKGEERIDGWTDVGYKLKAEDFRTPQSFVNRLQTIVYSFRKMI